MKNPAAGGGRWVEVPPERFVSWIMTFAERHGGSSGVAVAWLRTPAGNGETVTFSAADGATAQCHPPFPSAASLAGPLPPDWAPGRDDGQRGVAEALAADAAADRTVGVLLVRLGGYAVGVFRGAPPRLVSSKAG